MTPPLHTSFIELPREFPYGRGRLFDVSSKTSSAGFLLRATGAQRYARAAIAAGIVALALSSACLPAGARDVTARRTPTAQGMPTSPAALQVALNARIQRLNQLALRVSAARALTPSDRSVLTSLISNDLAGLASLQASSATDSTNAAVHADATSMVLDFHVFSLVTPVVLGVIRGDAAHCAAVQIAGLLPSIQASILASNAPSGRIAQAKSLLSGLPSMLAAINSAVLGISGHLLGITPASVPSILPSLNDLMAQITGADQQVKLAYAAVNRIIALVTGNSSQQAHAASASA